MPIYSGYNHITLIRRPFKKMGESGQSSNFRTTQIGNFDLIPLEEGVFYNKENNVFPVVDNSVVTIDNTTKKHNGKIYLISDPDVGVLIPHILKQSFRMYHFKSMDKDIDDIVNLATISSSFDTKKSGDFSNSIYSVPNFIFVQPVFLKIGSDWYAYVPKYRINDDDVHFERISANSFITHFNETSESTNDVVISNQNINDIKFTQLGIGKNGIELKNGLKYRMDKSGNVDFNIGNIKSDSLKYFKKPMDNSVSDIKLETVSYTKGDVLSGTSFSSLLSSILFDIYDETKCSNDNLFTLTTATQGSSTNAKVLDGTPSNINEFELKLKFAITTTNPTLTVNGTTLPIKFNNDSETISLVPAGYYIVQKQSNFWKFNFDSVYHKLNMFMKKVSNYDILLIKK